MSDGFQVVDNPLIEHVVDQLDGIERKVGEYRFDSDREVSAIRLRVFEAIEKKEPNIICATCHTPVYPRKDTTTRRFHFVHVSERDETSCPYNDKRKRLDTRRIDAMRYNGQKEGPDHKRVKRLLRASIDADLDFDPSCTHNETHWYGSTDERKWRKPDIAATWLMWSNGRLRIAFEIQLSSTYLKVIAERRNFYLEEHALLFWVFKDATGIDPRQYQNDLFYNNNSNLFVVDEETAALSQQRGKLVLRCFYLEPTLDGTSVRDEWRERLVSMDELTLEPDRHLAYFFDYTEARREMELTARETAEKHRAEVLRIRYRNFWKSLHQNTCDDPEAEWRWLSQQLYSERRITVPAYHDRGLQKFTQLVLSAEHGEPFMSGHRTLLEVANNAFINAKPYLWYFGRVLEHRKTWTKLITQDQSAAKKKAAQSKKHTSWRDKGRTIRVGMESKDPDFVQDRKFDALFKLLFPDIPLDEDK